MYIDGFNLYYGALKGGPHKWLDLAAFCEVLLPKDEIRLIRYFTALVSARPDDADKPQRQQTYLRALATIPNLEIHYGHYLTNKVRMPLAEPKWRGPKTIEVIKTEEKGSDVNLATYLLLDAFEKRCDTAVVISNDSDLSEPVKIARTVLGLKLGIVNPHQASNRSRTLQATFFKQVRKSALAKCQFPDVLQDAKGQFRKPTEW
ncbi:MAG: NYN domain-containing protein [Acidimicrobiia bacterium]